MNQRFYIIAKVNSVEYLTKLEIDEQDASACRAEHFFLDAGIIGHHEYGCEACMAYDVEAMKTDAFIGAALYATPVSLTELMERINQNNQRIRAKEAAEGLLRQKKQQLENLLTQAESVKKEIAEAAKTLASAV